MAPSHVPVVSRRSSEPSTRRMTTSSCAPAISTRPSGWKRSSDSVTCSSLRSRSRMLSWRNVFTARSTSCGARSGLVLEQGGDAALHHEHDEAARHAVPRHVANANPAPAIGRGAHVVVVASHGGHRHHPRGDVVAQAPGAGRGGWSSGCCWAISISLSRGATAARRSDSTRAAWLSSEPPRHRVEAVDQLRQLSLGGLCTTTPSSP